MKQYSISETELDMDKMAEQNSADQYLHSRLLFDKGEGFNKSESICVDIRLSGGVFEEKLQLKNLQNVKLICLELTEKMPCACDVYLRINDQTIRLKAENNDGIYQNQDMFLNKNPQYFIEVDKLSDEALLLYGKYSYMKAEEIARFTQEVLERYEKREKYAGLLEDEIIKISNEKDDWKQQVENLKEEIKRLSTEKYEQEQYTALLKEEIVNVSKEKDECGGKVIYLEEEVQRLSQEKTDAESSKNQLQEQLLLVESSRGWKALNKIRTIRNFIRR